MERLSVLDGAFLRVETPSAHMHVAWRGIFSPASDRPRPDLEALRRAMVARLRFAPRFRRRIAQPALGVGEPYWVDDPDFHIDRQVVLLADPDEAVTPRRFQVLCDRALSEPLPRDRPLWRTYLAPRLDDGRMGLLCKMHHALVDGKSAVELALLLLDLDPDADPVEAEDWRPAPAPGGGGLALRSLGSGVGDSLAAARGVSRALVAPRRGAGRVVDTLRRAALAIDSDIVTPAPPAHLNGPGTAARTLQGASLSVDRMKEVRRVAGVTFNDVYLAVVSGALRELALTRGTVPRSLKAMVPVSVRTDAERSDLGNRISFAFVELPVGERSPARRLSMVHAQTQAFKRSGRVAGTETLLGAAGLLPPQLRGAAARLASGSRSYNVAVSNVPGPQVPAYLLGARLDEVYPVVPFPEGQRLSFGVFTYHGTAYFGAYADPVALPEVKILPDAVPAAMTALARSVGRAGRAAA